MMISFEKVKFKVITRLNRQEIYIFWICIWGSGQKYGMKILICEFWAKKMVTDFTKTDENV